jgi:hypothetical protein
LSISLTNSEFRLKIVPYSGSAELFQNVVKRKGSNSTDIGFPGKMHLFAKFGEYPNVELTYAPQQNSYPSVIVQLVESSLDYDIRGVKK